MAGRRSITNRKAVAWHTPGMDCHSGPVPTTSPERRLAILARFVLLPMLPILFAARVGNGEEYVVKPGDTLSTIAEAELSTSRRWGEIARLNDLQAPYAITSGQRLRLPEDTPPSISVPAPATVQPDAPGASTLFPLGLWIWMPVGLVLVWGFTSICVRIACWFSLVETTIRRCAVLALAMAGCLVLCFCIALGVVYLVGTQRLPVLAPAVSMPVLVIWYLVMCVLFTKRILDCRWRSVLTVGVMASFVADVLAILSAVLLALALPGLLATQALQKYISQLV